MKPFRNGISQLKHIFWTFSFENNQIKSSQSLCRRGSKKYNELQIQWIPNDNKRTEISMKNNLFEINWFETAKWTNERKKKPYETTSIMSYPHIHIHSNWIRFFSMSAQNEYRDHNRTLLSPPSRKWKSDSKCIAWSHRSLIDVV